MMAERGTTLSRTTILRWVQQSSAVMIRGIELAKKIKKQQFNLKPLTAKASTAPEIWAALRPLKICKASRQIKTYT
jgi:hypothetical protein